MRRRTSPGVGAQQRNSTRPSLRGWAPSRRSQGKRSDGTSMKVSAARRAKPLSVTAVTATVAWISYTPVKGLALVQPGSVQLTERGVADDRRFHVIDARGRLTNAKRLGVLQQVTPAWDEASGRLAL